MEIETLFGIPAHPLVVHAAVVLLPLAALITVVTALWPKSRKWWAPLALGIAFVGLVSVVLAQGSGEKLEHDVKETELVEEHTEKGETVLPWAIGLTVVAGAVTAASPLQRRYPKLSSRAAAVTVGVVAVIVAAGAVYTVIEVGHSGAKATWDSVEDADDR